MLAVTAKQIKTLNPYSLNTRSFNPYSLEKYIKQLEVHLNRKIGLDESISLLDVLNSIGLDMTLQLALPAIENQETVKKFSVEFACRCIENVLPNLKEIYPPYSCQDDAIKAVRSFMKGEISLDELKSVEESTRFAAESSIYSTPRGFNSQYQIWEAAWYNRISINYNAWSAAHSIGSAFHASLSAIRAALPVAPLGYSINKDDYLFRPIAWCSAWYSRNSAEHSIRSIRDAEAAIAEYEVFSSAKQSISTYNIYIMSRSDQRNLEIACDSAAYSAKCAADNIEWKTRIKQKQIFVEMLKLDWNC